MDAASNTQVAVGGSQPPTQLPRRFYAQPLDPNYGSRTQEAWVKAHLHRQEQMQRFANEKLIIEQQNLAKDVKVWYQAGSPPKTIRVTLSTPDIFVPDEHPALREVLGYDAQFLDVFHVTPSSSSWTMQMWSVPVGTVKHQPVLVMRTGLQPEECEGVTEAVVMLVAATDANAVHPRDTHRSPSKKGKDKEVPPHVLESSAPSSSPPTSSQVTSSSANHLENPLSSLHHPSAELQTPAATLDLPSSHRRPHHDPTERKFPLVYACDMAKGLEAMVALTERPLSEVKAAFKKHFSGCVFVRQTYYKHKKFYRDAKKFGILQDFVLRQHTDGGRWSQLVKVVQPLSKACAEVSVPAVASSASDSDVEIIEKEDMAPEEEGPPYEVMSVFVETYNYHNGELGTWRPDGQPQPATIHLEPFKTTDQRKNIYWMICAWEEWWKDQDCVLKKVSLPGIWWEPAPNKDIVYVVEGMRLSRAHFILQDFKACAERMEVTIHPIDFTPTFLVSTRSAIEGIAQPALSGKVFTRQTLFVEGLSLAVDTLDAYAHYLLIETRGLNSIEDLQGMTLRDDTLCLFDCTTHTKLSGVEYESNEHFSLGNRGDNGIWDFTHEHEIKT
ncbi:hypothetical protein CPC08DRAFT_770214 [Agrocybe pediades]|nr:hypothetical protein CPC08DRAFT_770214 [Agrocybe pediades]